MIFMGCIWIILGLSCGTFGLVCIFQENYDKALRLFVYLIVCCIFMTYNYLSEEIKELKELIKDK